MTVKQLREALAAYPEHLEVAAIDGLYPVQLELLGLSVEVQAHDVMYGIPPDVQEYRRQWLSREELYFGIIHYA